jgi:hypothetical protein
MSAKCRVLRSRWLVRILAPDVSGPPGYRRPLWASGAGSNARERRLYRCTRKRRASARKGRTTARQDSAPNSGCRAGTRRRVEWLYGVQVRGLWLWLLAILSGIAPDAACR